MLQDADHAWKHARSRCAHPGPYRKRIKALHRQEHAARYTTDLPKRDHAAGATQTIITNTPPYRDFPRRCSSRPVYYVNWIDWFPGTHRATDAFRRLTVTRLSDGAQIDLADLAKLDLPAFLRAPIGAAASLAAAVTPGSTVPVHYTNGAVIKPPAIAMAEWLSKHNDRRSPNGEYVGALNATKGNQRYLDKRADHATKKREKRLAKQAALAARRAAEAVA